MGQCVNGSIHSRRRNKAEQYNEEPADTKSLETVALPSLEFHYLLSKIKLKRCTNYLKLGIKVQVGADELELKPKGLIREVARWDVRHTNTLNATQYQLRKKFFKLSVLDSQKIIGQLKINLYLLATGPYHQDFSLPLPQSEGARVSFNLKISQEVTMMLRVKEAVLNPHAKQYPGDTFVFSARSILANQIEESEMSYKYAIAFENTDSESSLSSNPPDRPNNYTAKIEAISELSEESRKLKRSMSPTKGQRQQRKSSKNLKDQQARYIAWSEKLSKQMPSLTTIVPLYELHGATLSIIFYSLSQDKADISSECFVSLNKLVNEAYEEVNDPSQPNLVMLKRSVELEMKTWDHGKEAGTAMIKLQFGLQKHIKQMQICVRTQEGILESSPVFFDDGSASLPPQIDRLEKLSNDIQGLFIESINASQSPTTSPTLNCSSQNWVEQVKKRLKQQRQILLSSNKQSKLMFVYQDEKALLKGQRSLIALGFKIRSLLNEEREELQSVCWELLIALVRRAEFNLQYIGFTKAEIEEYNLCTASEFLLRKKEVAASYYTLMVDLLHITLQALENCYYESQRQFAQLFCAYAYFRLAAFRKVVLQAISHQDDPDIEEWRGTEFSLTEQSIDEKGRTTFSIMFDWQNHFQKVIQDTKEFQKSTVKLSELLQFNGWQERIKKRGGAFFSFVRYWVTYVEGITINSKHISWRYFPGYNKLLIGFLLQLKSKPLPEYSDSLKNAAMSLLSNEKLLNALVLIVLRKTNNFDQISVFRTFELIHLFLGSISRRNRCLPTTFDYKVLLKAMRGVLEGQSCLGIGKVLLVLYDHFTIFPVQFRVQISMYLLNCLFFKLFLHWSSNVRAIFQHLLFVRIYRFVHRSLSLMSAKEQEILVANPHYREQLVLRYQKVITIVENAGEIQVKSNKSENSKGYGHLTTIKRKISEKRRQKNVSSFLVPSLQRLSLQNMEEHHQLMEELSSPRIGGSSSVILEHGEVPPSSYPRNNSLDSKYRGRGSSEQQLMRDGSKRKLNYFERSFERDLVPMRNQQLNYIQVSLEEYRRISQQFSRQLQSGKETVPALRLEMPLDQKQLRPEGLTEHEEW